MLSAREQLGRERSIGVTPGQVIRPPSTALLTIDSGDRFKSQIDRRAVEAWIPSDGAIPTNYSAYDFTINKDESIMNGFFTRLAVTEVVFPWAIPNINVQTNKMFIDTSIAGVITTYEITLEDGFYTPAQLAAAIEAYVVANIPTLTGFLMEYSPRPYTNCFAYETNSATLIGFRPVSYNSTIYNNDAQIIQLFDLLGFSDLRNTIPQPAQAGNATLCQFTRYVDIVCSQLIYNQSLKDTSSQRTVRDALCRVYLGDSNAVNTVAPNDVDYAPPGCTPVVIYRNFSTPKQIQWMPNQPVPGYLRFQIYDDNGIVLSQSGANVIGPDTDFTFSSSTGLDWSMTMLVSEN
jgi:hypothetical protein